MPRIALLATLLSLLVACGGKQKATASDPPDEIEAIPFPSTRMLQTPDLARLTSAPDGTLTFAVSPPILGDADVGTVLVAGISPATPVGLLRVVTRVEHDGEALVLHTVSAPLQLAFRKLHVRMRRTAADFTAGDRTDLSTSSGLSSRQGLGGDAAGSIPIDIPIYDADGDSATTDDQIVVKGSIGGGFAYDLTLDVDWGDVLDLPDAVKRCVASVIDVLSGPPDCSLLSLLPEIKVSFEIDPHFEADLKMTGAASLSYMKEIPITTIVLAPLPIGPLVFLPSVTVLARVEGSAAAGFGVGAHGKVVFATGFSASSKELLPKLDPLSLRSASFDASDTQVTLAASAKVGLGAQLDLQLYGIVGPHAGARVFARVSGDVDRDPCWEATVGLEADIGASITTPALPGLGSVTLFDWTSPPLVGFEQSLAHGSCLPVPDGPQLPPGAGPDPDSLAHPDFTPWLTTIEDTTGDGAVRAPSAANEDWTDLTLAIDGRYVVAGSRTDRLIKVDDHGKPVWTRRYRRDSTAAPMMLTRVAPTASAGMLVLAIDESAVSLLRIGQAGMPLGRALLGFPDGECPLFEAVGLIRDGGAGFFVLGRCRGTDSGVLVHLDEALAPIDAWLLKDGTALARSVVPDVMVVAGGEPVLLGKVASPEEGTTMFAARLDPSGQPTFARRYLDCQSPATLAPLAAQALDDGQILVAGSSGNNRSALMARLRADGEVAFAGVSTQDQDDYYFFTSFSPLPTSGFAAVAVSHGVLTGISSLALVTLDAGGRPLSSHVFDRPDARDMAFGAVRLTNHGGAVLAGATVRGSPEAQGAATVFEVFAKDGQAQGVAVSELGAQALDCVMTSEDWPVVTAAAHPALQPVPTFFE